MNYIRWCAMVDHLLGSYGFEGRDDIPDAPWADWFAEGQTPSQAVVTCMADIAEYL